MKNGNQRDRSRGPVVGTSWLMACTLAVATLASACGWWGQLLEPPPPDAPEPTTRDAACGRRSG